MTTIALSFQLCIVFEMFSLLDFHVQYFSFISCLPIFSTLKFYATKRCIKRCLNAAVVDMQVRFPFWVFMFLFE